MHDADKDLAKFAPSNELAGTPSMMTLKPTLKEAVKEAQRST